MFAHYVKTKSKHYENINRSTPNNIRRFDRIFDLTDNRIHIRS